MSKDLSIRFCAFLLILLCGCMSLEKVPPEQRSVQRIHEINLRQNQIFDKSLEWMARTFVDSKEVIELKDREGWKIIGKGITDFLAGGIAKINCRFTMVIDIKDGKYRTTYENLIGLFDYGRQPQALEHKDYIDQVKIKINEIDDSLYRFLGSLKATEKW